MHIPWDAATQPADWPAEGLPWCPHCLLAATRGRHARHARTFNLSESDILMGKKKDSTVARIVAPKEWELKRAQERITYPPGYAGPIQMDWRVRESYSAKDLDYRGRTKTE